MASWQRGVLVISSVVLAVAAGCATAGTPDMGETEDDGAGASGGAPSSGGSDAASTPASSGSGTASSSASGATTGAQSSSGSGTGSSSGSGGGTSVDGTSCSMPADVTLSTFPEQLVGTFTDTTSGGSCDTTADNAVWFSYTPPASGFYAIALSNATSTAAYSRVAVYETAACAPNGPELACTEVDDVSVSTTVELVAGTTYLIQFYTDGSTYTMVDPSIDIAATTIDPGDLCTTAVDVTGQTMPHQILGQFDVDPPQAGSCDTSPTNAVWMQYTPPVTATYVIDAANNSSTGPWSRLAVFEGTTCAPLGSEIFCDTDSESSISGGMVLNAGTTYTIAFHTDGDTYTMVDPTIDITAPGPDPACSAAVDVSGMSFPHTQNGTFGSDPMVGGTCDTTPTNAVYFRYTPTTTGLRDISAFNNSTSGPWSRLAVFQTSACDPYGTELACATDLSESATVSQLMLQAGTTYLIMFYTDGDSYTMVDPELTITP